MLGSTCQIDLGLFSAPPARPIRCLPLTRAHTTLLSILASTCPGRGTDQRRNGGIEHFYQRDLEEHLAKRAAEAEPQKDLSKDPQSDTYAVTSDGNGELRPL